MYASHSQRPSKNYRKILCQRIHCLKMSQSCRALILQGHGLRWNWVCRSEIVRRVSTFFGLHAVIASNAENCNLLGAHLRISSKLLISLHLGVLLPPRTYSSPRWPSRLLNSPIFSPPVLPRILFFFPQVLVVREVAVPCCTHILILSVKQNLRVQGIALQDPVSSLLWKSLQIAFAIAPLYTRRKQFASNLHRKLGVERSHERVDFGAHDTFLMGGNLGYSLQYSWWLRVHVGS